MLAVADGFVTVIGIHQRKVERAREIERDEAERQMTGKRVGKPGCYGRACLAFLRNGREAVIRGDDYICGVEQAEFAQRGANAGEIVVRIADRRERSRSVDAGNEGVQA